MYTFKCVWRRENPPQNFKLHTQFLFFEKVIKDVCCIIIASWKKNSSNLLKAPKIITTIILITSVCKLTTTVSARFYQEKEYTAKRYTCFYFYFNICASN